MENSKNKWIGIFERLGERLAGFGGGERSREVIGEAVRANHRFSTGDIIHAVGALREDMLRGEVLRQWLAPYNIIYSPSAEYLCAGDNSCDAHSNQRRVGIIMAGNIPLVGFHDMMCALAAGWECYIKPSSKDAVLIDYMVRLLKETESSAPIYPYSDSLEYDAVIATGSDNTNRYFRDKFAGVPSLLRGSRYSAAVLEGTETDSELAALAEDIFRYNGMGCRSVSLLFVPRGYDVELLAKNLSDALPLGECDAEAFELPDAKTCPRYFGDYRQAKGLLTVLGRDFIDGGHFVMTRAAEFPASLSVINYTFYDDMADVDSWLSANNASLQVVVSRDNSTPFPCTRLGGAQHPAPWDYPDRRDVIEFLINL